MCRLFIFFWLCSFSLSVKTCADILDVDASISKPQEQEQSKVNYEEYSQEFDSCFNQVWVCGVFSQFVWPLGKGILHAVIVFESKKRRNREVLSKGKNMLTRN